MDSSGAISGLISLSLVKGVISHLQAEQREGKESLS